MVPENDFSKLNLNDFQNLHFVQPFRSVNAFAVIDVPLGPDPATLLAATSPATRNLSVLLHKLNSAAIRLDAKAAAR